MQQQQQGLKCHECASTQFVEDYASGAWVCQVCGAQSLEHLAEAEEDDFMFNIGGYAATSSQSQRVERVLVSSQPQEQDNQQQQLVHQGEGADADAYVHAAPEAAVAAAEMRPDGQRGRGANDKDVGESSAHGDSGKRVEFLTVTQLRKRERRERKARRARLQKAERLRLERARFEVLGHLKCYQLCLRGMADALVRDCGVDPSGNLPMESEEIEMSAGEGEEEDSNAKEAPGENEESSPGLVDVVKDLWMLTLTRWAAQNEYKIAHCFTYLRGEKDAPSSGASESDIEAKGVRGRGSGTVARAAQTKGLVWLSIPYTVAYLHLATRLLSCGVTSVDMVRWIDNESLPYRRIWRCIPVRYRGTLARRNMFDQHRTTPSRATVERYSNKLAHILGVQPLPPLHLLRCTRRLCAAIALPPAALQYALRVVRRYPAIVGPADSPDVPDKIVGLLLLGRLRMAPQIPPNPVADAGTAHTFCPPKTPAELDTMCRKDRMRLASLLSDTRGDVGRWAQKHTVLHARTGEVLEGILEELADAAASITSGENDTAPRCPPTFSSSSSASSSNSGVSSSSSSSSSGTAAVAVSETAATATRTQRRAPITQDAVAHAARCLYISVDDMMSAFRAIERLMESWAVRQALRNGPPPSAQARRGTARTDTAHGRSVLGKRNRLSRNRKTGRHATDNLLRLQRLARSNFARVPEEDEDTVANDGEAAAAAATAAAAAAEAAAAEAAEAAEAATAVIVNRTMATMTTMSAPLDDEEEEHDEDEMEIEARAGRW